MTAIQLKCQCNSYSWGKFGRESLAARYAGVADHDFHIDHHKPYAEMWMGTYPTTPSVILSNGELLQKHIDKHPDQLIGPPVLTKYGTDLPFLPKVYLPLSTKKPERRKKKLQNWWRIGHLLIFDNRFYLLRKHFHYKFTRTRNLLRNCMKGNQRNSAMQITNQK